MNFFWEPGGDIDDSIWRENCLTIDDLTKFSNCVTRDEDFSTVTPYSIQSFGGVEGSIPITLTGNESKRDSLDPSFCIVEETLKGTTFNPSFPSSIISTGTIFENQRSVWFPRTPNKTGTSVSTNAPIGVEGSIFVERALCGAEPINKLEKIRYRTRYMGYLITLERMLFLDGMAKNPTNKFKFDKESKVSKRIKLLTEKVLDNEGIFRANFPLNNDGLVVALGDHPKIFIRTFGRPPLGAAVLRVIDGVYRLVLQSKDDKLVSCIVQTDDLLIVADWFLIGKNYNFTVGESVERIAQTLFDSNVSRRGLVVVARIKG